MRARKLYVALSVVKGALRGGAFGVCLPTEPIPEDLRIVEIRLFSVAPPFPDLIELIVESSTFADVDIAGGARLPVWDVSFRRFLPSCRDCERGDIPRLLDENGVLSELSGKPGLPCHAYEDSWWLCPLAVANGQWWGSPLLGKQP